MPAWLSVHILRHAGKVACRVPPVTSTLGLAGANARAHGACSSLRSRSQTVGGRVRRHRHSSSRSYRFGSSASRKARPAFFVSAPKGQFVLHRSRTVAPTCRRRASGARGWQWRGCQRRCQRRCVRGLTGRSTGGAAAGRLARAAPFVYPAPRGQGNLPRPPGYLYVRPRRRQSSGARAVSAVRAYPSFMPHTKGKARRSRAAVQKDPGASRRSRPTFSVAAPKGQ